MAQFYAYDFIYDGIPSQKFGLRIISFEDGSLFNGVGSSDIEVLSQSVLRKSKPYYLGRTQPTVLEFPLTFGTAYPISGMERDLISQWLFGRSEYKKLYILQDDLNGAYFNCFMTAPQPLYIGNINYAFTCTVKCDSPWAYKADRSISGSVVGLANNQNKPDYYAEIYNGSSEDEYLYPIVEFTFDNVGSGDSNPPTEPPDGPPGSGEYDGGYGSFVIVNFSDTNSDGYNPREFVFENVLAPSYYFYFRVDNDLQIVSSKQYGGVPITGGLQFFNKKWFRLLPGLNKLGFFVRNTNDVCRFKITWTERMKIGG